MARLINFHIYRLQKTSVDRLKAKADKKLQNVSCSIRTMHCKIQKQINHSKIRMMQLQLPRYWRI